MIYSRRVILFLASSFVALQAADDESFFGIKYLEPKPVVNPNLSPEKLQFTLDYVVSFTLENQWDIFLSYESVEVGEGNFEITHAPFNLNINASYEATRKFDLLDDGHTTDHNGDEEVLDIALTKLYRLGTQVSMGANIDREKLFPKSESENHFHAFFTIDQPLLRRYMWSLETATEIASYIELKAIKWEMVQEIAAQIQTVAHSYWDLMRAKQQLQVNIESEKRLMALADYVERLINSNQLAASERNQAQANLFAARNLRVASEQTLYSSYNNLLFEMGEEPCDRLLDPPHIILDDYPDIPEDLDITLEHLICLSENHRGDLLAAEWRVNRAGVFLRYANNALLPEVDLQLGVAVDKVTTGDEINPFFNPVGKKPQKDLSAGVSFNYPLCNDFARGTYRRTYAEVISAELNEEKLRESIRTALTSTWRNHRNLMEQIKLVKETVRWYHLALVDEVKRFHNGVSTLFVVIQFEDRLNSAQSDLVQLYHDYANNLVDLLFITGLLAVPDETLCSVYITDLKSAHDLLGKSVDCIICKERK